MPIRNKYQIIINILKQTIYKDNIKKRNSGVAIKGVLKTTPQLFDPI